MSFCRRSTYGQKLLFLINFWKRLMIENVPYVNANCFNVYLILRDLRKCQMIENVQYVNANCFNVYLILSDLRKCQLVECNFFHFGLNCNSTS
jgi:hypothetical protein